MIIRIRIIHSLAMRLAAQRWHADSSVLARAGRTRHDTWNKSEKKINLLLPFFLFPSSSEEEIFRNGKTALLEATRLSCSEQLKRGSGRKARVTAPGETFDTPCKVNFRVSPPHSSGDTIEIRIGGGSWRKKGGVTFKGAKIIGGHLLPARV